MDRSMSDKIALFGKYEVGRLLGCGAFAKVYYARNLHNGQSVAIKMINKKKIASSSSSTLMGNIKREITIMRRLRHPNIVRLYEVLASKSKIYFVMEYVKGGELFAKVAKGRFSEDLARKYFRQLISAIGYCHTRGIYHRDLKPENLLIDDKGDLKVSDFGLSAAVKDTSDAGIILRTLCGTPAYVAPEILAKKGYQGATVDVWSCGVVLYVLTAGYLPFNDPNLMAMYKKIYKGEFKCPKWMSSDLKRFLSRLLDVNPTTRITLDHIIRDPWFTKGAPFTFSFYHDDYYDYDDSIADKNHHQLDQVVRDGNGNGNGNGDGDSSTSTSTSSSTSAACSSLNAFDLISFSSGLNLSGLFDQSFNPIVDGDKFMSEEPAHKILDKLEEIESAEIKFKRRKDWGIDLQGPNANFVARVEIRPLTDNLVVVEVMKIAGDSVSYNEIWNNKVRPHLAAFVYGSHPEATTELAPDPEPEPEPDFEPHHPTPIQLPALIDESN